MTQKIMTSSEMRELAEGTDPFLMGIRNLVDTCKFHLQDLAAVALPGQTQYFDVPRAPGVCNLEKVNQVSYPLWITSIGVQIFGVPVDVAEVHAHTQVVIEKDNREYKDFPTNVLCGGGGLTMAIADGNAATLHQFATHGLDNGFFTLPVPINVVPEQILRVILEGDGTILGAVTGCAIILRGVESRPVR